MNEQVVRGLEEYVKIALDVVAAAAALVNPRSALRVTTYQMADLR